MDEFSEFCGRRVDVSEHEHVEHEDAVVIKKVLEGSFAEGEGDVGVVGYAAHVGDAVDFVDYFPEGEIPCIVDYAAEFHFGDWDVPGFYWWWWGIDREELHVDCVCVVW